MAVETPAWLNASAETPAWLQDAPAMPVAAAPTSPSGQSNALWAGLKAGMLGMTSQLTSAAQAGLKVVGADDAADFARRMAARSQEWAAAEGRQDLEEHPWSIAGMGYQLAKAAPMLVGGLAAGALVPMAAVPAWLARAMPFEGAAATAAGRYAISGAAVAYPTQVGANVQEAQQGGRELTRGQALGALAVAAPEAALAAAPIGMAGAGAAAEGAIAKRMLAGAARTGITNAGQSAATTAITDFAFGDPNQSLGDRARKVVDSALSGGFVGGVFGAATHALGKTPPKTEDLSAKVDETPGVIPGSALGLLEPNQPAASSEVGAPSVKVTRPFEGLPVDEIQQRLSQIAGIEKPTTQDTAMQGLLQRELAQRTPPGAEPGNFEFFTPDEMGARVQPIAQLRAQMEEVIGPSAKKNPFIQQSNFATIPELIAGLRSEVDARAENGTIPKWLLTLGRQYGVVDKAGAPRDLPAELGQKQQAVSALEAKYGDLWQQAQAADTEQQRTKLLKDAKAIQERFLPAARENVQTLDQLIKMHGEADALGAPKPVEMPEFMKSATPEKQALWQQLSDVEQSGQEPFASLAVDARKGIESQREVPRIIAEQVGDQIPDPVTQAKSLLAAWANRDTLTPENMSFPQTREGPFTVERSGISLPIGDGSEPFWRRNSLAGIDAATAEGVTPRAGPDGGLVLRDLRPDILTTEPPPKVGPDGTPVRADIRDADELGQARSLGEPEPPTPVDRPPTDAWLTNRPRLPADDQTNQAKIAIAGARDELTRIVGDKSQSEAVRGLAQRALDKAKVPQDLSNALNAIDKARAATTKVNPFEPAPGDAARVRGTDSVPAQHVGFIADLLDATGLNGLRVLLVHPEDVTAQNMDAMGANGPYAKLRSAVPLAQQIEDGGPGYSKLQTALKNAPGDIEAYTQSFGPDNRDFFIYAPRQATDAMSAEVLATEFGRIVQKVNFNNASGAVREAVFDAFNKHLQRASGMKAQDFFRVLRPQQMAEEAASKVYPSMMARDLAHQGYWNSFDTWFSSQVARWAMTADKPRTAVERFFSSVGDRLKEVLSALTGRDMTTAPDKAVSTYMNRLQGGRDNARLWIGEGDKPPQFAVKPQDERGPTTLPGMEHVVTQSVDTALAAARNVGRVMSARGLSGLDLKAGARQAWLGFQGLGDMMHYYGREVPELAVIDRGNSVRDVLNLRWTQLTKTAHDAAMALPRKTLADVQTLMEGTRLGLDPTRPWADHEWLQDHPQLADLQSEHARLSAIYQRLKQVAAPDGKNLGAAKVYDNLAAVNRSEWAARAAMLGFEYNRSLPAEMRADLGEHPQLQFRERNDLHTNPVAAADWWRQQAQGISEKLLAQRDALSGQLSGLDAKKVAALRADIEPLDGVINHINHTLQSLKEAPYFPLTRYGDYGVSARFLTDAAGLADGAKVEKLSQILADAGFGDVALRGTVGNPDVFVRVANRSQMVALQQLFKKAQADNLLDPKADVSSGNVAGLNTFIGLTPKFVDKMLSRVNASAAEALKAPKGADDATLKMYEQARTRFGEDMRQALLDMLPEQSITRNLQSRFNVQGYSSDMLRNFAFRSEVGRRSMSNLTAAPDINDAIAAIGQRARDLKTSDPLKSTMVHDIGAEILRRESDRNWRPANSTLSQAANQIRSLAHSFYLGASPAYLLLESTQVATTLWPQLSKTHGFTTAAKTIAEVMPEAFKVMRGIFGGENRWNPLITEEALRAAGVRGDTIKTLIRASNDGHLETGGFTLNFGKASQGEANTTFVRAKDMVNSTASYVELFTRVVAALSAKKLYDAAPNKALVNGQKASAADFVSHTIRNSMFDWGSGSTSRQLGPSGFAGQMTPLITQFQGFQFKFLSKMFLEMHDLFGSKSNMQERVAAGKWLGGMLAATTVLAGSLASPFATTLMAVADRVGNVLTNRDDWDLQGEYRNFLADVFGKSAGEALAKGLPRLAGVDTAHLGFEHIIPFTEFLTDKRKLEDSYGDWAAKAMGAPASGAINFFLGAREMGRGNYLSGLQRMVPTALRGPVEATRWGLYGYQNSKYQALPIAPSTGDIAMRAFGLHPADRAQYEDKAQQIAGLEAVRDYRRENITKNLLASIEQRDQSGVQSWMQEAHAFDLQHLGHPITPALGGMVMRRAYETAQAKALGMPLGVSPRDLEIRQHIRY